MVGGSSKIENSPSLDVLSKPPLGGTIIKPVLDTAK